MSRTNPYKAKPCEAKRTVIIVAEGSTEWAFLSYLKKLFLSRNSGLSVKIENAHGGSPETIIATAKKFMSQRAYDRCLILMDMDRIWPQQRPQKVGRTTLQYAGARPCIEGLLLTILKQPGISAITATTDHCKRIFHQQVMTEDKKTTPSSYERYFTKTLLDNQRKACPELDIILSHLE
jgi:hypothetical protein